MTQNSLRTLLIVDDAPEDRVMLRRLLERDKHYDYRVLEAEKGAAGLEMCRREQPDCILLDFHLPDVEGLEVLQRIAAEFGLNRIPVVMLSGDGEIETGLAALRTGAQDFLVKGHLRGENLLRAVSNAIEKVALFQSQKQAEDRLRRQSLLIEQSYEPIFVWQFQSGIVEWNAGCEQMYGFTRAEAVGCMPNELLGSISSLDNVFSGGSADTAQFEATGLWTGELQHRTKDGRVVTVESRRQLFRINDENLVLETNRDITQRKQTELDARFLAGIGTLLGQSGNATELIESVTQAIGRHFGVSRCALHEIDLASGQVIIECDFHDGLPSLAGTHAISSFSSEDVADFAAGRIVVRGDTQTDPRTAPLYAANYAPLSIRALVVVPLLRLRQLGGALWITSHEPRVWTDNEVSLLHTVAERMWLAVENARLQMATQELNNKLELRVVKRTKALRESQTQLRHLSAYVERAREDQRTRIAREVHDELGSSLTGLKMTLMQATRGRNTDEDLMTRVMDMSGQIDGLVQSVRRIASDLRPPLLDDLGLVAALEWQASEWTKRTGILCQCDMPQTEVKLDRERRTAVFRAFQESLTNVARHAQATQVMATLRFDRKQLVLVVRDNGRGISPVALRPGKSLGLMGLRERIREVAGDVDISGVPGKGTTVSICVPLA